MKSKSLLYFLILLTIVFLMSACSAVQEENTNWQTYENSQYVYAFDYPADCTDGVLPATCKSAPPEEMPDECLCFLNSENPDRVLMQRFQKDGDQLVLAEFSVTRLDVPVQEALDETGLKKLLAEIFPDKWDGASIEAIEIDGVTALSVSGSASEMAPAVQEIYFTHHNYLFQVSLLNPALETNNSLYERILSSFRFDRQGEN